MARHHWPPRETWEAMKAGKLPTLIGRDAVCALTGWTCATLLAKSRIGKFVRPQTLLINGRPILRWETEQVAQWLSEHGFVRPATEVPWRRSNRSDWQRWFEGVISAEPSHPARESQTG
jgi:hypothetical protein